MAAEKGQRLRRWLPCGTRRSMPAYVRSTLRFPRLMRRRLLRMTVSIWMASKIPNIAAALRRSIFRPSLDDRRSKAGRNGRAVLEVQHPFRLQHTADTRHDCLSASYTAGASTKTTILQHMKSGRVHFPAVRKRPETPCCTASGTVFSAVTAAGWVTPAEICACMTIRFCKPSCGISHGKR